MDKNITIPKQEIAPGVFTTGGTATIPSNIISTQTLQPVQPINLQGTTPTPTVDTGLVANALQGTQAFDTDAEFQRQLDLQKQTTPDQTPLNDILASLTTAEQGLTGRGTEQLTAETQAGLPQAQQQRAGIQGQIKSGIAEYNALKTEFEKMSADIEAGAGRKGLTTGAVTGQQGAVDRAKLARLNSKASEIGLLQAQDLALAGQIETAQNIVNRAIDLKYQDREQEYKIKQAQYDRVKEFLTAEETKRGKALEAALKKEEVAIAEAKENEKAIESIALKIAEFGGDPNIIKNAKTPLEAISMAGNKLQDPVQKLQMQKLRNEIAKQTEEVRILKQYGGLTPEQWAKKQEEALKGLDTAKRTAKDIENQKNQIGTILSSTAINSVVGPTAVSRSRGGRLTRTLLGAGAGAVAGLPFGGLGAIPGAIAGGIAGATLPGISDEVSGRADDTVALVEQMLSQQFLDKLITVKGQGATFGALTDREGNSLRSAANAISQTAIEDKNGKIIGYDMSENEFKRQFGIMNEALQLAEIENTGKVINDSEDADLETLWQTGGALVAPGNYYQ